MRPPSPVPSLAWPAPFILLPPTFDPTPGFPEARAVIDAVKTALLAARPGRVVMLSTIGAQVPQPNLLNQLGLMEQALADPPMPVSFLRAGWFIENAAWDVEAARKGLIHSTLQPLDRAIPMVSVEDVGRVAAELLTTATPPRIVELQGPALVSPRDIAAAFARLLGHPVAVEAIPRNDWEGLFRAQGMTNPEPRMQMLDGFNAGWICFEGTSRLGTVDLDTALAALL